MLSAKADIEYLRETPSSFQLERRALAGFEKALGPEHESTLTTVRNLDDLCVDQGRLAEAEEMYMRAIGKKKELEPEHMSTISLAKRLGSLRAFSREITTPDGI